MNELCLRGLIKCIVKYNDTKSIFVLAVDRLSGISDTLPVKIDTFKIKDFNPGDNITIIGKINSQNVTRKNRRRVAVFVYAESIAPSSGYTNEFKASGKLCIIKPIYQASKNRTLLECILSVERTENKYDYIPLVFWGDMAREVSQYSVGTYVSIEGRFQSRKYYSKVEKAAEIVYEVSVSQYKKEREKCLE